MRAKRLAQESRSPAGNNLVPHSAVTGEGSVEIAPGVYTCCQCSAAVPIAEAFRQPSSVSFGAVFCPVCANEVSRCYNLALSRVALNPIERLNMLVEGGVSGDDVPPLEQLGFRPSPQQKTEVVDVVDVDEIIDID